MDKPVATATVVAEEEDRLPTPKEYFERSSSSAVYAFFASTAAVDDWFELFEIAKTQAVRNGRPCVKFPIIQTACCRAFSIRIAFAYMIVKPVRNKNMEVIDVVRYTFLDLMNGVSSDHVYWFYPRSRGWTEHEILLSCQKGRTREEREKCLDDAKKKKREEMEEEEKSPSCTLF